jgi:hypothetical protein
MCPAEIRGPSGNTIDTVATQTSLLVNLCNGQIVQITGDKDGFRSCNLPDHKFSTPEEENEWINSNTNVFSETGLRGIQLADSCFAIAISEKTLEEENQQCSHKDFSGLIPTKPV